MEKTLVSHLRICKLLSYAHFAKYFNAKQVKSTAHNNKMALKFNRFS